MYLYENTCERNVQQRTYSSIPLDPHDPVFPIYKIKYYHQLEADVRYSSGILRLPCICLILILLGRIEFVS